MTITLTKQEQLVLTWVQRGLTNKQIAQRLKITESTIKFHVSRMLKKYAVRNRVQLISFSTNNTAPVLPPVEVLPFAWVHLHGNTVKGILFGSKKPKDGWQPLYLKVEDDTDANP
jgi:DNA-binding CsgD family transcriptional regulator